MTPRLNPRLPARPEQGEFAEHVALFAVAIARDRALELLEGFTEAERHLACARARAAAGWDSATRQARLQVTFGSRPDSELRLRALMAEAGPALRQEIFRVLKPYQRSLFPDFALEPGAAATPFVVALAERLVREATRC